MVFVAAYLVLAALAYMLLADTLHPRDNNDRFCYALAALSIVWMLVPLCTSDVTRIIRRWIMDRIVPPTAVNLP